MVQQWQQRGFLANRDLFKVRHHMNDHIGPSSRGVAKLSQSSPGVVGFVLESGTFIAGADACHRCSYFSITSLPNRPPRATTSSGLTGGAFVSCVMAYSFVQSLQLYQGPAGDPRYHARDDRQDRQTSAVLRQSSLTTWRPWSATLLKAAS
jgi:hypothetical protein